MKIRRLNMLGIDKKCSQSKTMHCGRVLRYPWWCTAFPSAYKMHGVSSKDMALL
jgi:hypothetical protein